MLYSQQPSAYHSTGLRRRASLDQHTHDHHHADTFVPRIDAQRIPRIGIGGPVGSGKTALIERLAPLLLAAGCSPLVITNDIYTQEDAEHVRRTLDGVLEPQRVVGVETGCCPH